MAETRFTITANKPDGTFIKISDRNQESITNIQNAMVASKYTNIKVTKDPTPEVRFVKGLMEMHNIPAKEAVKMYKSMSNLMATNGIDLVHQKERKT